MITVDTSSASKPAVNDVSPLKWKIYGIIEDDITNCLTHKIFEIFISILILSNVIAVVLESFNSYTMIFKQFEMFSVSVFTIEYILRLWVAECKYPNHRRFQARLKFIISPMGLVDLFSILPFYLPMVFPTNLDSRVLRIIRLLRLLRLFKLGRFLDSFRLIQNVIKKKKYELYITAFIVFLLLMISSTLMYEIEHSAQPDKFPNIISSFWWAIATLTTIGYGDVYPITGLGKVLSAVISLIGIGLVALPTGIISSGFLEEFRANGQPEELKNEFAYCPHCWKKLHTGTTEEE